MNNLLYKNSFINCGFPWGWKDPRNTFTLKIWLKIFPQAKVLNIERHPLDTSLSLLNRQNILKKIDLKMKSRFYYPLTNILSISHSSLISSTLINDFDDCLKITRDYINESKINKDKYNENILNITYEDLLTNPLKTIEKIFKHCNISINNDQINTFIKSIDSSNISKYKKENFKYNTAILDELGYNDT